MAFVSDSRYRGYLGPNPAPSVVEGDAWIDFLHDVVAGTTGMDPTKVFPRWQPDPPVHPPLGVDWAAIGETRTESDWQPAIVHVSGIEPDITTMWDAFQRMVTSDVLCTFYGPNAEANASLLRDGLFINQNSAELRRSAVCVVEVREMMHVPELFRQKYLDRVDLTVVFRREIRRNYPVLNIVRAYGIVEANPPFDSRRIITTDFDTDRTKHNVTVWDHGQTLWDEVTWWDLPGAR